MHKKLSSVITSMVVGIVAITAQAVAADTKLPTKNNPDSNYVIRYDDWDLVLSSVVLDVGPSDRRAAGKGHRVSTASRIRHGNTSATAFEGNRVMFSEFKDEHVESLLAMRKDIEAVADFVPLEELDQWEQLAYWYNLHNVAVVYEIAKAYPVKKIKSLVEGRKAVWDNKTMSVAGTPVSIKDIEDHVIETWDNPLVLYGFFMGTVGGPNIRTSAFTGDNVVEELQRNAVRFVNSLRGFRSWSGDVRVSDHYEMGTRLFPNFEEDLRKHLMAYSRPDSRAELQKANRIKVDNYDWAIADIKDGSVYNGSSFNTNPGALAFFIDAPHPGAGRAFGVPVDTITPFTLGGLNMNSELLAPGMASVAPQTQALLRAVKLRNDRRVRQGEVTVEEFVSGEGARVTRRTFQEQQEQSTQDSYEDTIVADD